MDTLKNRKRIGSSINKEVYEKLHIVSKNTGIPISKLLDRAIIDLLTKM